MKRGVYLTALFSAVIIFFVLAQLHAASSSVSYSNRSTIVSGNAYSNRYFSINGLLLECEEFIFFSDTIKIQWQYACRAKAVT